MDRIFKIRHFARWMRKTTLTVSAHDSALQEICHDHQH
jgi:hypothetical protein